MPIARRLSLLAKAVVVLLAAAFLVVLWKPELLRPGSTVVEVHESDGRAGAAPAANSYASAVNRAAPAVVNINSQKLVAQQNPFMEDPLFRHFFGDQFGSSPQKRLETSLGSGVIVSPQGYILTNNHVIEGADEIQVSLRDGRDAKAKVVGSDPEADLAVLKVDLSNLPAMTLGHSDDLQVGDVVLAIGNPFGVGQTVTHGIVSATGRNQLGLTTFENFIQTDAPINPGNSGGALVNSSGELVGINTAIFTRSGGSQGIGFAIPVSLARGIMEQIIETGKVSRGWLGVEVQNLSPELAESFNLKDDKGVVIAAVLRGGPASSAGLQPGDVVTRLNGKPVSNVREALDLIAQTKPGSTLKIEGQRNGKPLSLMAKVTERPAQPQPSEP